jgi:CO/xanthine dehydrogenase Mo-binding subunit
MTGQHEGRPSINRRESAKCWRRYWTPARFLAVSRPACPTEALVPRAGYGDVEAAFATAPAIVALDLAIGRHSAVPIETRGALARFTTVIAVRRSIYGPNGRADRRGK